MARALEALSPTELLLYASAAALLCTGNDTIFLLFAATVVGEDVDGTHVLNIICGGDKCTQFNDELRARSQV